MSRAIQRRRGNTAQHASFTGLVGELTINTSSTSAVIHDNVTVGGIELLRRDFGNGNDQSITRNFLSNNSVGFSERVIPYTLINSTTTGIVGNKYLCNTGANVITLVLPSSPSFGDEIHVIDSFGNFGTNNVTVDGGSNNVMGANTFVVDVANTSVGFVFATTEWRTI